MFLLLGFTDVRGDFYIYEPKEAKCHCSGFHCIFFQRETDEKYAFQCEETDKGLVFAQAFLTEEDARAQMVEMFAEEANKYERFMRKERRRHRQKDRTVHRYEFSSKDYKDTRRIKFKL